MGILRGPSLKPHEGQFFEKLPKYGFQPIGITTYDNETNLSEFHFPMRVGHNFKTLTKGKLTPLLSAAGKVTKYNFASWNRRVFNLKNLTSDLDLIYSADTWYPYTYQAVKTGIPTIITEWENIPYNVEEWPYGKNKKYNTAHAAHFVAITEKAKATLIIDGVDPDKISVVPAGIDCELFKPAEKNDQYAQKIGLSKDSLRILFVGRLVPEKGIFDLLNAFSMLLKKVQNVELMLRSSGSSIMQMETRRRIENLQITDKVKFLGGLEYYSDMPKMFNEADVFCLPSVPTKTWSEQFGFALAEAMACGKPVVSTLSGSIPEVVKDNVTGILVKPSSPLELESALEELIKNRGERDVFGRNARAWVLERFEANKIAGQLANIFCKFV